MTFYAADHSKFQGAAFFFSSLNLTKSNARPHARQPSAAMVDYSKFNNLDISDDDEANENEL